MLILLNTTIMTSAGVYQLRKITLSEALEMVSLYDDDETVSYIGHESTAQIMSEVLGISVPVNRDEYSHRIEDVCLCFKLSARTEEGKILTREEIDAVGYTFYMASYVPDLR